MWGASGWCCLGIKKTKNMANAVDIVVICIFLVVSLMSNGVYSTLHGKRPYNIAHRGSSGSLPENTVMAHQKAMQQGTYPLPFCLPVCLSVMRLAWKSVSSCLKLFHLFLNFNCFVETSSIDFIKDGAGLSHHNFNVEAIPLSTRKWVISITKNLHCVLILLICCRAKSLENFFLLVKLGSQFVLHYLAAFTMF